MKSGIPYKQGEIVIVPFPFSDLSSIKQRPVLILSNDEYNAKGEDIVTCGITSNLGNAEHSVLIDNTLLAKGRLPKKSRIKVDKLFTLEKRLVRERIARLQDSVLKRVKEELLKVM